MQKLIKSDHEFSMKNHEFSRFWYWYFSKNISIWLHRWHREMLNSSPSCCELVFPTCKLPKRSSSLSMLLGESQSLTTIEHSQTSENSHKQFLSCSAHSNFVLTSIWETSRKQFPTTFCKLPFTNEAGWLCSCCFEVQRLVWKLTVDKNYTFPVTTFESSI